MPEVSTKPYLIRAIVEWCIDAGFTPYIAVAVDESVRVPQEFVKNGEIVLNVSSLATHRLQVGNEAVEFQARFSGAARDVVVPIGRVIAVYARENGQGMAFEVPRVVQPAAPAADASRGEGPRLRAVEPPKSTMSLVPVALVHATNPAGSASGADDASNAGDAASPADAGAAADTTRPPNGDRPRLTRIK